MPPQIVGNLPDPHQRVIVDLQRARRISAAQEIAQVMATHRDGGADIQPAGIEAAVKLTECAQFEDDEKRKALELALERARYEEKRAHRQFDAVEPENRLVASELEARWNGALAQLAEVR